MYHRVAWVLIFIGKVLLLCFLDCVTCEWICISVFQSIANREREREFCYVFIHHEAFCPSGPQPRSEQSALLGRQDASDWVFVQYQWIFRSDVDREPLVL